MSTLITDDPVAHEPPRPDRSRDGPDRRARPRTSAGPALRARSAARTGDDRQRARRRLVAELTGVAVGVLGLVVIVGWLAGIDGLLQIRPTWVAMQFNTAVGLLLGGGAVVAAARPRARVANVAAGLLVLLGGLTLLQYIVGIDLGIDELVVEGHVSIGTSHPGRMAPNTAIAFVLLGAALLAEVRAVRTWIPGGLAAGVVGLGSVALFGYAARIPTAYSWAGWTQMAVHTGVGVVLIGAGTLAVTRNRIAQGGERWIAIPTGTLVLTVLLGAWSAAARIGVVDDSDGVMTTVAMVTALVLAAVLGIGIAIRGVDVTRFDLSEPAPRARMSRYARSAIVVVLVIPLATIALTVYVQQQDALRTVALERLDSHASVQEQRLASIVDGVQDRHALVASRTGLRNDLAAFAVDPTPARRASIRTILEDAAGADGDTVALTVFTPDGVSVAAVGVDVPTRTVPTRSPARPTSSFRIAADGGLRFVTVGPLELDGVRIGTLVSEAHTDDLLVLVGDATVHGQTGETLLVATTGDGTARFVTPSRFGTFGSLAPIPDGWDLPVWRALDGDETILTDLEDYRGVPVLAATRYLDDPGWGMVVKVDEAEAFAATDELRRSLGLGVWLSALAGIGVAALVGSAMRRAEDRLRDQHRNLRQVLATAPVGITFVDGDGVTIFANARAETLLRMQTSQLPGRYDEPSWRLERSDGVPYPPDELPVARTLRGEGPSTEVPMWMAHPDGTRTALSVSTAPARLDGGDGVIVAFRDVTEQLRSREQLQRYVDELEQFAYIAAHDLQEPLRMVVSFTELFARRYQGQLDGDAEEFVGYAVDGAHRIKRSLDDLLAYINAAADRPLVPVGSARIVDVALTSLQPRIQRSRAAVTVDEDLPIVLGDERQLLRVFQTIIDNALTYHGQAPPVVRVTCRRAGARWQFSIADEGIGIEAQHIERVFRLFRRLHTQTEYQGTGLGLAIVKKIIERHDGEVWIESTPGVGTTVHFTLPGPEQEPS